MARLVLARQLEFFEQADQWVPRGHVLRCVVMGSNGEPDEPFLTIDDRDFTPRELARMVGTFGGWGMRIAFVTDDDVYKNPLSKCENQTRNVDG